MALVVMVVVLVVRGMNGNETGIDEERWNDERNVREIYLFYIYVFIFFLSLSTGILYFFV